MKTSTYKNDFPNQSGEYVAQIDVLDTQIHIISETKKERNLIFKLLDKVLKTDQYQKVSHITYWTIQHRYPEIPTADKWCFSSYDNIASPACDINIPKGENRFEWVYFGKYGATSLRQAKIGLSRIVEANKNDPRSEQLIFRIVKVTHFFDVVEPITP